MTRFEANFKILEYLSELMVKYPDLRFGQMLYNLDILRQNQDGTLKDIFNTESTVLLDRVIARIKYLEGQHN